jgi:hypothetical protein
MFYVVRKGKMTARSLSSVNKDLNDKGLKFDD